MDTFIDLFFFNHAENRSEYDLPTLQELLRLYGWDMQCQETHTGILLDV
jgi:hypothetical protein